MKKRLLLTSTLAIGGLLFACAPVDEEVATYDGGVITESEFTQSLRDFYGESHLQQLIIEDIIESNYGEQVTEEDVEQAYAEDVENSGGETTFENILDESGYTPESYKQALRFNLMLDLAMLEHTEVTEEEVVEEYENYEPTHKAAHILVESKSFAEELVERLNAGEDFGTLAGDYSEDTGTSLHGGELDFLDGELVPEFEEAFSSLEDGEYTQEPVQSGFGYHIILAVEKGSKADFEDLKEELEQEILERKMFDDTQTVSVLSKLVEDAGVEIHAEDLENALAMYMGGLVDDTEFQEDAEVSVDADAGESVDELEDELSDADLDVIQELIDQQEESE